jgi:1-deoxy-D-xylulose-5-phosphate synthase
METDSILQNVNSPEDIKRLSYGQLNRLASEIRGYIIRVVAKNGGHLASNLGVVELTLALHRVFETPRDKIIWDVGHQCYAHKIVTGRREDFPTLRRRNGVSGFPKRSESPHDSFNTGHSSTSLSAALGLLLGQELRGDAEGKVIAVIGDGALTGGMAFEALSHAGQVGKNLIVVLNDNKMSIGPNVGAMSRYLSRLSATAIYQNFRKRFDYMVTSIPVVGKRLYALIYRGKRAVKALFYKENLFADLGYEYVGPIDGHNIPKLVQVFKDVRNLEKPVVVHIITRKGKGYRLAESDPAAFHGIAPFSIIDGTIEVKSSRTFTEAFSDAMIELGSADPRVAAVSAAMTRNTGLSPFQAKFPTRFFDVGIAEQHAVTFSAGLASAGMRPVVALYSTFVQRAVDQVIHDVALQGLPVTIALDRAGLVGDDGETHQGIFDISLFRSVPGLAILAPGSAVELRSMLAWALASGKPAILRYPKAECPRELDGYAKPIEAGRGSFLKRRGGDSLIVAFGALCSEAVEASTLLADRGLPADVYALRFAKPLDGDYFLSVCSGYRTVVVVEDGVRSGGVGEGLVSLVRASLPGIACDNLGVADCVRSQAPRDDLLEMNGLTAERIADRLEAMNAEVVPKRLARPDEIRKA